MEVNNIHDISKRPFTALIEPFQGCNMSCRYCYSDVYNNLRMSAKCLETVFHRIIEYLDEEGINQADILWHGGEPLMAGIDFFKSMFSICERNDYSHKFRHLLQTNGTLINEEWCRLIKEQDISISISLDGPADVSNKTRIMKQAGKPSFEAVTEKSAILTEHSIPFNFLVVVSKANCHIPEELYNFFSSIGRSFKINPVMKSPFNNSMYADLGVTAKQYGEFMTRLFRIWMSDENSSIRVGTIDTYIKNVAKGVAFNCQHQKSCIDYMIGIKYDGSATICSRFQDMDHISLFDYKISQLKEIKPFSDIAARAELLNSCNACEFYSICSGGCPNHAYSFYGNYMEKDYFCLSYKMIYSEIRDFLKEQSTCR